MHTTWWIGLLIAGTLATLGAGAATASPDCDETQPYDFDLEDGGQCVSVGSVQWGDRTVFPGIKIRH